MYSVDRFVQELAKTTQSIISEEVISEIIKVSQDFIGSDTEELSALQAKV